MSNKMCPFLMTKNNKVYQCMCQKSSCAWWDDLTGHCAILSISRHGNKGSFDVVQEERKQG